MKFFLFLTIMISSLLSYENYCDFLNKNKIDNEFNKLCSTMPIISDSLSDIAFQNKHFFELTKNQLDELFISDVYTISIPIYYLKDSSEEYSNLYKKFKNFVKDKDLNQLMNYSKSELDMIFHLNKYFKKKKNQEKNGLIFYLNQSEYIIISDYIF